MHVLLAGGTGMVGTKVRELLQKEGHQVTVLSRSGGDVQWDTRSPCPVQADAVVNLAGASIGGRRWNRAYKQELYRSRVETTKRIAKANPDAKWIQASAIGYYGRAPEGICEEGKGPGDDFLARLCRDWESAAPDHATILRFGHVLDATGGFLGKLQPIYKARIGGPIGRGRQGLPWVHADDLAAIVAWALQNGRRRPYNVAAPGHVTQGQFNRAFAKALGVLAVAPLPGPILRLVVGELGSYLTVGQHTPPSRLLSEGYQFRFPDLESALADLYS